MTIAHPTALSIALALAAIGSAIAWRVFAARPILHRIILAIGLLLLAFAAGGVSIAMHPHKTVTVLVDLSPSTRGAGYRDRSLLENRIRQLVGELPFTTLAFSDSVQPLPADAILPDLPCDRTQFHPPAADAILLFSDGRFDPPLIHAPVFPVIDPLLQDVADARVSDVLIEDGRAQVSVTNTGDPRSMTMRGTNRTAPLPVPTGAWMLPIGPPRASEISATLSPGDRWPENDSLTGSTAPADSAERWWIGENAPPGWIGLRATDLPTSPGAYLAVSLIAISNIPADALSLQQQSSLTQYVRDLGGGLLILGGDRAFAAGGYPGSALETLSPLSSSPPTPVMRWVLLVDSSGSMASPWNNGTRFDAAVDAVKRLLPLLPANQTVSVGAFARDLTWWIDKKSTSDALDVPLPPSGTVPSGPTNLQMAVKQLAASDAVTPTRALLLTDADATVDAPEQLAAALVAANVRIDLLALKPTTASNPVVRLATGTGGRWIGQDDPGQWVASLRALYRAAFPSNLVEVFVETHFANDLRLPPRKVATWNRTWPKAKITSLATAITGNCLAATWEFGSGDVVATAFSPVDGELAALADRTARLPRDPHFHVSWDASVTRTVSIDTADRRGYLNGLHFTLQLVNEAAAQPLPILQMAPGKYALALPAQQRPALAVVRIDNQVIDRRMLWARYAPEFEAVGNDLPALQKLAEQSGGAVIPPTQTSPLDFHWPLDLVRLDSVFSIAGFICIAGSIVGTRLFNAPGGRRFDARG